MKAVIMAGGKGKRIRSVAQDLPKSMIPVCGKPILSWQIENLKTCGIRDIIIITGYLKQCITDYFGNGEDIGVNIDYFNEETPLGTAGALAFIKDKLDDDFLLLMGDLVLSVDFERFMQAHRASGGLVTLFTHPNSHPADSDLIVTGESPHLRDFTADKCGLSQDVCEPPPGSDGFSPAKSAPGHNFSLRECKDIADMRAFPATSALLVKGFIGKKEDRSHLLFHNLVNAGIYALSPKVCSIVAQITKETGEQHLDLDSGVIRPLIKKSRVYAYKSTEYVKDMGTPKRFEETALDLQSGIVSGRNLKKRQACVFMDRDGTINEETGFLTDPKQIKLIRGAGEAIKLLNNSRYLAVIITNQPVVARGELSFEGLDDIFKAMEMKLGEYGAYVDAIYYCPHHEKSGFEGELGELKFPCYCRKPKPGMILRAARELNIDLSASYMIGDMTGDILCGQNAGVKTIALRTGYALSDGKYEAVPDLEKADLLEAVKYILQEGQI